MSLEHLPFNAFDILVLAVVVVGIFRGRKHGMSEELLPLLTWVSVVVGAGLAYEPVGQILQDLCPALLKSGGSGSPLLWYVLAYALVGMVILLVCSGLSHSFGGKMVGSDVFGRMEYYLGMTAGAVRFGCFVLIGLALLHAVEPRPMPVQALEAHPYGFKSRDPVPAFGSIQAAILKKSFCGAWLSEHADFLLIKPSPLQAPSRELRPASLP